jgi:hypothetical protein
VVCSSSHPSRAVHWSQLKAPERPNSATTGVPRHRSLPANVRGPDARDTESVSAVVVLAALGVSVLALAVAPALMPENYSWIINTTSESAGQGVNGAWVARLGFLMFGLSVIWLASQCERSWGRWAVMLHMAFGVFMTAAAVFSSRSWVAGGSLRPY